MQNQRRKKYLESVEQQSLSFFYAGRAPHLSNDAYYPFEVNKNFWYLTNIDQEDSVMLLVKSKSEITEYLFIKKVDPVLSLWVGETLSFKAASELSGIKESNVLDIADFDSFVSQLLAQNRKAIHGEIKSVYFDIERQSHNDDPLLGERKANAFKKNYPHLVVNNSHPILARLRSVKDAVEIMAIKGAISISQVANQKILDILKQVQNEHEVLAQFNYTLNLHQTVPSFNPIVAAGQNSTILHYEKNNMPITRTDLILLDLGVRYQYYASDISRTYPLNGKFTKRQREIYQAVLNVNKEIIKWVKAGITQQEYNAKGKALLIEEAKKIGLIKKDDEITKYYYHSLGHPLGLDVHDVSDPTLPFEVGQVITVEPGLYISEEGIGVRIEDDLLITETGCINLSESIIKEVKDIELYMKN